jgi:uncharacterized membrane protein (UPF0127 family)
MGLKKITYTDDKSIKKIIKVKKVSIFSTGLMFRRRSDPLLFDMGKSRNFSIHSLFCKPFTAIWLDEKFNTTCSVDIFKWKINISGKGRYLLEIPLGGF